MKCFFDTEFIENGKTIELISIGMVREDGAEYYAESGECDLDSASQWVKDNVFPSLTGIKKTRPEIAKEVLDFCGLAPTFYAWYASYDWVALCQLYGTMMDLPKDWPMFVIDLRALTYMLGSPSMPKQDSVEHNALDDARHDKMIYDQVVSLFRSGTNIISSGYTV